MLLAHLALMASANAECTDFGTLEQTAARGKIDDDVEACLEGRVTAGTPEEQVRASFVLILDSWATRRFDCYEAHMQRHLALAPTDAEVAYLYATYLHRTLGKSDDEVLRWARVALDGRRRWVSNRNNHDRMVKGLYDVLVEASMERAIAVAADQSAEGELVARTQREAKYWLAVAGPCLHRSDCGPYYEVEVEGYAECDDLDAMEARTTLSDEQSACLRGRFRRPTAPKDRITDLLVAWANATEEGTRWDLLRGWHWRVTETEDALLLAAHAAWLAEHAEAQQALETAELALAQTEAFKGKEGLEARRALLELVIQQAEVAQVPERATAARAELDGQGAP